MLNWIIGWSLRNRFMVVLFTLGFAAVGLYALSHLPIDAFPDTTPVQVQINTVAPALGPLEIEQQVTFPVEQVIAGLPKLTEVRSISKFGLSQVTATFEDGTDIYFARQLVNERLGTVELPDTIERPEMGPVATGLGEVFHYIVTGKGEQPPTLEELTTLHDWVIRPQLRSVQGVAEVNTWGGERKQYHVLIDPVRLIQYKLSLDEINDALRNNNLSVGGGYLVKAGEATVVQGSALTTNLDQIADIVLGAHDGIPLRIRDVAQVRIGSEIRRGAVTFAGQGEAVLGLGFMLMGENSHEVTKRLEARLEEARKSLPPNVDVHMVYRRTELVDRVIATVKRNLWEGALLVIAVLFMFLGNFRAGLIVAIAIPLAMLFSFSAMAQFGIAASLLSLGAIDFGLVVDSSVIVVENSVRRLGHKYDHGGNRPVIDIVRDAAVEVRRPTMFGELIIMVVYLPILLLEGVEGKLFRPMALTVIFALTSSLIFSITLTPVLCSLLLSRNIKERENFLVRFAHRIHRPFVWAALKYRWTVTGIGVLAVVAGVVVAGQLGSSFIPRLYEESIVINTVRLAGVALDESVRYGTGIEQAILRKYPDEVRDVWSRTGTAEVATDPMGMELTDVFITLKPRQEWKRAPSQADLTELMAAELSALPGMRMIFTQPIEMRMNEMIAGIRADVGIKIFGDDLDRLKAVAKQVQDVIESIPGSADIVTEQVTGQPVLQINVDQDAIARLGIPAEHVLQMVEALGGIEVGEIREGQRRFPLVVKLAEAYRQDPDKVADLLVRTAAGERIPLGRLAEIKQVEGPSTINREWQKRRIVVQCNVRGRDLHGFVEEARQRIADDLTLPAGYFVTFGGQFEHLERASMRLMIVVPLALIAVFVLLCFSTHSVRDALVVFTGAPFAAVGGVFALWIRDMEFTISAGIGFVAVSGVSMLAGLVLVATIRRKIAEGMDVNEAIGETRLIRLRAILMTAFVATLGFVPMAFNTGVGAEVQRPLATVVIGGLIVDNTLTLLILPALYSLFGTHDPQRIRLQEAR